MTVTEVDYVVVGAGSAGCVLADRLTACGRHRVLVLEAGGSDRRLAIRVPLGYALTFADRRLTWRYRTEPDPGLNGRSASWPRGRVIGGCSSINAMAYVRGLPEDFDDWERQGAAGWNWRAARKTFADLESEYWTSADGGSSGRGSGPVPVGDLGSGMHPFSRHFMAAAADLGWPVNGPDRHMDGEGVAFYRSTVRDGRRVSAADAFLSPARRRPNLQIVSNAVVTRLEMGGNRAPSLRFRRGDCEAEVIVRGEIILSAGAINSPHLLQLSGIGPADTVAAQGIRVVKDLQAVGRGLQDHLAVTHHFEATEPTLNTRLSGPTRILFAGLRYLLTRGGPLAVPINQVGGFVKSMASRAVPDVQIYCNPATYTIPDRGLPRMNATPGFSLSAQPCRPTSRGRVALTSPDPRIAPSIEPNSLASDADIEGAIAAGRIVAALAATPTLRAVTRGGSASGVPLTDDAAFLEDFRQRASTVFHPCCTCRMGNDERTSAVDSRLRVHGLRGLRVVDASAFPSITSGNINAPTLMLAHRAADMILEDARQRAR
ncbi:MAG: GMC family oxidoreductase N-terminal domain-containing protein [Alphaproteobacteria bacterium]|nr:GMC family oxidoreductase N-terminal domain-containing protein [Alphaproteobacteria bacterium]